MMGKRGRRGAGRQKRKKEESRGGLEERVRGEREKGGVFSITIIFNGHFTCIPSTGILLLAYKARLHVVNYASAPELGIHKYVNELTCTEQVLIIHYGVRPLAIPEMHVIVQKVPK